MLSALIILSPSPRASPLRPSGAEADFPQVEKPPASASAILARAASLSSDFGIGASNSRAPMRVSVRTLKLACFFWTFACGIAAASDPMRASLSRVTSWLGLTAETSSTRSAPRWLDPSACRERSTAPRSWLAILTRSARLTVESSHRVSTTRKPAPSRRSRSTSASCKLTSFSCPPSTVAPVSMPPWPGSSTIVCTLRRCLVGFEETGAAPVRGAAWAAGSPSLSSSTPFASLASANISVSGASASVRPRTATPPSGCRHRCGSSA